MMISRARASHMAYLLAGKRCHHRATERGHFLSARSYFVASGGRRRKGAPWPMALFAISGSVNEVQSGVFHVRVVAFALQSADGDRVRTGSCTCALELARGNGHEFARALAMELQAEGHEVVDITVAVATASLPRSLGKQP